jgi:hypothetical protein
MADSKITALDNLTSADPANDMIPIVDVSATPPASGNTKRISINNLLACSPSATLASATITGDLTVDTSTLKVDSTNNRVGIGTASPSGAELDVAGAMRSNSWLGRSNVSAPSGDCSIFRSADNTLGFGIASATAMTLNSTGLGIGNTPVAALDVYKTANDTINRTNATFCFGQIAGLGAALLGQQSASSPYQFNLQAANAANSVQFPLVLQPSGGNVGIGVTPSAWTIKALQVGSGFAAWSTSVTNSRTFANTYYDGAYKYVGTGRATQYEQDGYHAWYNSASGTAGNAITFTQAMTLDASGNLLVGTTAMPSGVTYARLVAKSTSADWSGVIWNSNATPYGFRIQHDTDSNGTGNEFLYCLGSTNLRASIRSNGGLANYQANDVNLSDIRTKTDIKPLASYWNKIKSLELVTFKYKDQTHNDDNIGLIAQQVESVAPELVDVDGFGETPSDGVPLKTIYTTDLYHASIKALQEAMTRIEALEAKLA